METPLRKKNIVCNHRSTPRATTRHHAQMHARSPKLHAPQPATTYCRDLTRKHHKSSQLVRSSTNLMKITLKNARFCLHANSVAASFFSSELRCAQSHTHTNLPSFSGSLFMQISKIACRDLSFWLTATKLHRSFHVAY